MSDADERAGAEHAYVARDTGATAERERLDLLTALADPLTARRLARIDVRPGWRCLEIGGGTGSVGRLLAGLVGPAGRVVITDLDPRFLGELELPNVEVRRHDVAGGGLERGHYDLVHCRSVLMHLARPEKALAHMREALRPGGWLFVEEEDCSSIAAADSGHPAAPRFDAAARAVFDGLQRAGLVDPYFGRRLAALVEALGLGAADNEGHTRIWRGTSDGARSFSMHLDLARRALRAAAAPADEACAALTAACADVSFRFVDATSFAAWAIAR